MTSILIKHDDQILVHRDGTDHRAPFSSVLASLPDSDVKIEGLLTYAGIANSQTGEPRQVPGEIWLLQHFPPAHMAGWIPDGAVNGDYLTFAEDTDGVYAWRIIGNTLGIDVELLATKEDLLKAYEDLRAQILLKADQDALGDQDQIQKNKDTIDAIRDQLDHFEAHQNNVNQDHDQSIQNINLQLDQVSQRLSALEQAARDDRYSIGGLEVLTNNV